MPDLLGSLLAAAPQRVRAVVDPLLGYLRGAGEAEGPVLASVQLLPDADDPEAGAPRLHLGFFELELPRAPFTLPISDGFSVELELPEYALTVDVLLDAEWEVTIPLGRAALLLNGDFLRPVDPETDRPRQEEIRIELFSVGLHVSSSFGISFVPLDEPAGPADGDGDPGEEDDDWWMVGETGVLIRVVGELVSRGGQSGGIKLPTLEGRFARWTGISGVCLRLEDLYISSGGVSGTVKGEMGDDCPGGPAEFLGFTLDTFTGSIAFKDNTLQSGVFRATIPLPDLSKEGEEAELGLAMAVDAEGDWTVRAGVAAGLDPIKTPFGDLTVTSIAVEATPDFGEIVLGGVLRPKEGSPPVSVGGVFDVPEIEVEGLVLRSDRTITLRGAWIRPAEPWAISLGAFSGELSAVGFGLEKSGNDSDPWLGFDAEFGFDIGVPISGKADRFRAIYCRSGQARPAIELDLGGVSVDADLQGVLSVAGTLKWLDDETLSDRQGQAGPTYESGFYGAATIFVEPLKLGLDGELLIGTTTSGLCVFGTRIRADLPTGIPIFSTGLSFYSFGGLLAANFAPTAQDEEWLDWFLAGAEPGIGPLDVKWAPARGALAFGVETVIGTTPDGGRAFSGHLLLALLFPGPKILLVGRGNVGRDRRELTPPKDSPDPPAPPLFQALVVYDVAAAQLEFGLTGNLSFPRGQDPPVVRVGGTARAFFDFNRSDRWYVHIGTDKEPFHGEVLELLKGQAWLMVDPRGFSSGARVEFFIGDSTSVYEAYARAATGAEIGAVFYPFQFEGAVTLEGELRVSAFGMGFGLGLGAGLEGAAPTPFEVEGSVRAWISIPLLITSKDISVSFSVGWREPSPDTPPLRWPVARLGALQERTGRSWSFAATAAQHLPDVRWERGYGPPALAGQGGADAPAATPVVPIDARPTIEFAIPLGLEEVPGLVPQLTSGFAPGGAEVKRVLLERVDEPEVVFLWPAPEGEAAPAPGGSPPAVWVLSPPPSPDEDAEDGEGEDTMSGPSLRLLSACPMPAGLTDPDSPLLHELVDTGAAFPARGTEPALALKTGLRRDRSPAVVTHLQPEARYCLRVEVAQGRDPAVRTTTLAEFDTGQAPGQPCPAPTEDEPDPGAVYPFGGPLTTFSTWVASTFPTPGSRFVYRRTGLWFRFDSPWCPTGVYADMEAAVVVPGAARPDWLRVELEREPDPSVRPAPPEHEFWANLLRRSELFDPALARWSQRLCASPEVALPGETREEPSPPPGRSTCQIELRCPCEDREPDLLHAYPAELSAFESFHHHLGTFGGLVVPVRAVEIGPGDFADAPRRAGGPSLFRRLRDKLALEPLAPHDGLVVYAVVDHHRVAIGGLLVRSPEPFPWAGDAALADVRAQVVVQPPGGRRASVPPSPLSIWRWGRRGIPYAGDIMVQAVDLRCHRGMDAKGWRVVGVLDDGSERDLFEFRCPMDQAVVLDASGDRVDRNVLAVGDTVRVYARWSPPAVREGGWIRLRHVHEAPLDDAEWRRIRTVRLEPPAPGEPVDQLSHPVGPEGETTELSHANKGLLTSDDGCELLLTPEVVRGAGGGVFPLDRQYDLSFTQRDRARPPGDGAPKQTVLLQFGVDADFVNEVLDQRAEEVDVP